MKLFSISGGLFSNLMEIAANVHPSKSSGSPMMPDTIQFFPVDQKHIRVIVFCPFNGVDMTLCVENNLEKPVEMAPMQLKKIDVSDMATFELDENDLVVSLYRSRISQRFSQPHVWSDRHMDVPAKINDFKEALKDPHIVVVNSDLMIRAVNEAATFCKDICLVFNGPENPVFIRPRSANGSISSIDAVLMPKRNV